MSTLTLREKTELLTGDGTWRTKGAAKLGLPPLTMTDGPSGLHPLKGITESATCFPSSSTVACSWDPMVSRTIGDAVAREALRQGISIVLGPGVNMKRSPLCGRNFEYYSEDPFLAGEMACGFVKGLQERGVGASLKHFAANNQEEKRQSVDARIGERALREIYLAAFETVITRAKPWTVMCAYNRLNGDFCSENHWLLHTVLREEWGYEGVLVTDWDACHDRVKGLLAGQDLTMPSYTHKRARAMERAVKKGRVPVEVLDSSVQRVLELLRKGKEHKNPAASFDQRAHHALARRLAGECAVLLKNEGAVLPLSPGERVALIGEMAKKPRFQGGGSAYVNPFSVDSAYSAFLGRKVPFVYEQGYRLDGVEDAALVDSALRTAAQVEKVVLFLGLPDSAEVEGNDRVGMCLPQNQTRLLREVSRVNPHCVVVLACGSSVEMPWLSYAGGLLLMGLSGEACGTAAADLLYGDVTPSGKLAETYPLTLRDTPGFGQAPTDGSYVDYTEGVNIGYRYYDSMEKEVCFPFGFGLSYTAFRYSDLKLSNTRISPEEPLEVRVTVTNTGERDGAEIVELYVADEKNAGLRPPRELKGFLKLWLKAGEQKEAVFTLNRRSFAYYDVERGGWTVDEGEFSIEVGASSRDIRMRQSITIES